MDEVARLNWLVPLLAFLLAAVFGAVAQRFNFCTMGAVSDVVNFGRLAPDAHVAARDRGRHHRGNDAACDVGADRPVEDDLHDGQGSLAVASGVACCSGFGMTLGSGCGSKTLIRVGGGNLKSLVVMVFLGIAAYMTLRGAVRAAAGVSASTRSLIDLGRTGAATSDLGALAGSLALACRGEALVAVHDRRSRSESSCSRTAISAARGKMIFTGVCDRRRDRRWLVRPRVTSAISPRIRPRSEEKFVAHEHRTHGVVLARGPDRVPPGVADPVDRPATRVVTFGIAERAGHDRGRRRDGAWHAHVPLGRFCEARRTWSITWRAES